MELRMGVVDISVSSWVSEREKKMKDRLKDEKQRSQIYIYTYICLKWEGWRWDRECKCRRVVCMTEMEFSWEEGWKREYDWFARVAIHRGGCYVWSRGRGKAQRCARRSRLRVSLTLPHIHQSSYFILARVTRKLFRVHIYSSQRIVYLSALLYSSCLCFCRWPSSSTNPVELDGRRDALRHLLDAYTPFVKSPFFLSIHSYTNYLLTLCKQMTVYIL